MIELTQEITRLIGAEGEKAYPNECCGALFGHFYAQGDARVTAIFPIVNARESEEQYHRFVIANMRCRFTPISSWRSRSARRGH